MNKSSHIFELILPDNFNAHNNEKAPCHYPVRGLFYVIRLGLEPRTPTLKVLCSTS